MKYSKIAILALSALVFLILAATIFMHLIPESGDRVENARQRVQAGLGEHFGKPVFIRIIKEDAAFELWVQERNGIWHILKTYSIAGMSGGIGPKTAEGDKQAPEGFYRVYPRSMNPRSKFHLAFNIGYPNRYDRELGRTGSFIMVHGSIWSVGCFAMTDAGIDEIYTLVNEAFKAGAENVPVQIYPFRMTAERMKKEKGNTHYAFWQHLHPGWQHTETRQEPYPDTDTP